MEYNNLINKIELIRNFSKETKDNINAINIVYCIDDNYSLAAGVSIYSLIENNKDSNISIHLFVLSLSEVNKNRFYSLIEQYNNISFTIYYVNTKFNVMEYNESSFPLSASLRVITPEILKHKCQNIIYIDSDTLINNSLDNLIVLNQNNILSAVLDYDYKRHSERLNLPIKKYFNSGLMVINTAKWSELNVTEQVLNLLTSKKFDYPDQDALNIVLNQYGAYLPSRYNTQLEISDKNQKDKESDPNAIIIHYLGPDKPWFKLFSTPKYKNLLNNTPWRAVEQKLAFNARRIRIYAKRIKPFNKLQFLKLSFLYYIYKIKQ